jgi:hypothetical protein
MMRQAGRYQQAYRDLAQKHPSFRERSENTDLIVEISLQPWESFSPDGVILFSDILTPLPAFGIPFEIDDNKGPLLDNPIRSMEQLKALHPIDLTQLEFVGESLGLIRREVAGKAAVLGFVGCPWTLATYVVEGASSSVYKNIKTMMFNGGWGQGWVAWPGWGAAAGGVAPAMPLQLPQLAGRAAVHCCAAQGPDAPTLLPPPPAFPCCSAGAAGRAAEPHCRPDSPVRQVPD